MCFIFFIAETLSRMQSNWLKEWSIILRYTFWRLTRPTICFCVWKHRVAWKGMSPSTIWSLILIITTRRNRLPCYEPNPNKLLPSHQRYQFSCHFFPFCHSLQNFFHSFKSLILSWHHIAYSSENVFRPCKVESPKERFFSK